MGPPGPHNARDMGTGPPQISSVIGTGGGGGGGRESLMIKNYGDPLVIKGLYIDDLL